MSLMIYTSILGDLAPVAMLKDYTAIDWTRSIRAQGGFWQGAFRLTGGVEYLHHQFNTWLGNHVVERTGGVVTWEGLVYELEFVHDGISRRRSFEEMANRVRCTYLDPNGEIQESAWVDLDESVQRYGQKDEIVAMDNLPQPAAEALRDRIMLENGWPWPRPVGQRPSPESYLEVTCCGYVFTSQWRYTTQIAEYDGPVNVPPDFQIEVRFGNSPDYELIDTDAISTQQDFSEWETAAPSTTGAVYSAWVLDDEGNLWWGYCGDAITTSLPDDSIEIYTDQGLTTPGWNGVGGPPHYPGYEIDDYDIRGPAYDWLGDIVANDCEFLQVGNIDVNLLQVSRSLSTDMKCWDVIRDVVELGDTSGNPWQFWVDIDRRCYYQQIDTTPRYYLRNGELYDNRGGRVANNPWMLRPAVVRDASYPVTGRQEYSGWLEDSRDMYVEEIEVDADGEYTLKFQLYDEADIAAQAAEYLYSRLPPEEDIVYP